MLINDIKQAWKQFVFWFHKNKIVVLIHFGAEAW